MFRKEEREKIVPLHFIRFYLYVLLWLFLDIREWRVILRRRTIFSLWFLTISCRSFAIIQATNIPLDSSNQYTKTVYDKMNEIKTMCVRDVVRIFVRHGFVFSLQRKKKQTKSDSYCLGRVLVDCLFNSFQIHNYTFCKCNTPNACAWQLKWHRIA